MHARCAAPGLQAVQHTWTYKPLVQDVLGMSLNRVTLDAEPSTSQQILQPSASSKKTYEVRIGRAPGKPPASVGIHTSGSLWAALLSDAGADNHQRLRYVG